MDSCVSGPAITVKCGSGDNLMIHAAVEFCKEGDIMVVTTKIKPGTVNGSVVCAGIQINAGDLILADDDGVVTVKQEEVEENKCVIKHYLFFFFKKIITTNFYLI